jgi:uncharacterized protein YndB with AHSA1/START domain
MTIPIDAKPLGDRDVVLCRIIDATREKVYAAYTTPEKLEQWWAPHPWKAQVVECDPRAGGINHIVMTGPGGERYDQLGVFLEVVRNEKVVFTDAYAKAWEPRESSFMTAVVTFEDAGDGKTKYTARVFHPTVADRQQHEQMGFHEGWGVCADQLEQAARQ